jgi:hypothetical protein
VNNSKAEGQGRRAKGLETVYFPLKLSLALFLLTPLPDFNKLCLNYKGGEHFQEKNQYAKGPCAVHQHGAGEKG